MNTFYKFRLIVETPNGKTFQQALDVDATIAISQPALFAPYDRCSTGFEAMAFGGVTHEMASRIDRDRRQLASDIATRLTKAILTTIKANDKQNGYSKE